MPSPSFVTAWSSLVQELLKAEHYLSRLFVTGQDVDVRTVLPDLGCLLTVPPPGDHIFAGLNVLGDDHFVGDHTKSPVSTAPALMSVVIGRIILGRHVGGVPVVPTLINLWTRSWEVGTIFLVPTSSWGSFLFTDLSRWTMLTPAVANECHT